MVFQNPMPSLNPRLPVRDVELAGVDAVPALVGLRRALALGDDGTIRPCDSFRFDGGAPDGEEALVTWGEVTLDGMRMEAAPL